MFSLKADKKMKRSEHDWKAYLVFLPQNQWAINP